ncbi:glycosyl hydrolase [Anaerocolumna sedimenticola]|uniref:Glycosyl hydrolase n=1 Tax=Anaerocolumna sedimenticola TaxID=2696063 RepID=A0A6P1TIR0_9FIRM|nr:glycoside hydrolase family 38 C-terminal domain-containing protein [Anaerocolumna sedimenticola]QHQ59931.1 glycosyl hydrolase [Anaerocolumna sedimenticola]
MKLNRKWNIYLIHHSHTDIGYTERQDKIINYHKDFIKQAIDILNDIHANHKTDYSGFVWQCENYWQVRNFYTHAKKNDIEDFEKYVKSGEIGLSGNYLNMTELINYDILNSRIGKAKEYGEKTGMPVKSGMTADINGFAWGYADALYENGVENLFSCLHPHHGMFPLYKKQIPFYWESPKGNKVLVWNGEHYHFGNELHFAPHAGTSYLIFDEYRKKMQANTMYKSGPADTEEMELKVLCERLERYLNNLEEENYPYDLVPFMVSGAITDNAPPSASIAKRVNLLNEKFAGQLTVKMVTLDQFFDQVKAKCTDIPTYKGDWNDWWADGVGSTPAVVKNFRDAQRKYDLCKKLDPSANEGDSALIEDAAENLMLYAEHTWGYSSSVSEPWETMVGDLELKKSAYAINGNTEIAKNLDLILAKKGEVTIKQDKPQQYKIINPHDIPIKATALVYIEFWEYMDGIDFGLDVPIKVVDLNTNEVLSHQIKQIARAIQVEVSVAMKPKEEKVIAIYPTRKQDNNTVKNHAHIGAEGVRDVVVPDTYEENTSCIETDFYKVLFDEESGIRSIIDKRDQKDIVRLDTLYAPFSGIYEVTDIRTNPCEERRKMGRNRKSVSTRRYGSKLKNIQVIENGTVYIAVQLDYGLEGTKLYSVFLKVYKEISKIEAMVRIHKESVYEPENLYISLPFTAGTDEVKYLDKTGCIIKPGIDQLPGSNKEFYLLQNGVVMEGADKDVIISVKDAPLITLGDLKAKPIQLCDGKDSKLNQSTVYSWVMNNYWETNFKVDLGGFYEFAYTIITTDKTSKEEAMKVCEAANEGLVSFYI